jgi:hypothetical protein
VFGTKQIYCSKFWSSAGTTEKGVRITTVIVGGHPTKETTLRDFRLKSKIDSLDLSKMGEVEVEVKETEM